MKTYPKSRLFRYPLPVVTVLALIFSVRYRGKQEKPLGHPRDYAAIAKEGILHVIIEYSSVSFYVDNDAISEFHHELIEAFAHDKGLKTGITPVVNFDGRLRGLSDGRYDVMAYGILAASELKDSLLLTPPTMLNKRVLVQRKTNGENDSLYTRNQLNLAQETLCAVKGSPYILRTQNPGNEVGDTTYIKEIEGYGSEQLISLVAHGDIDYAVCDESTARAVADSLPQVDINTAIGFTQFYSWAVGRQSPALSDSLNAWLDESQKEREYQKTHRKHCGDK